MLLLLAVILLGLWLLGLAVDFIEWIVWLFLAGAVISAGWHFAKGAVGRRGT